DLEKNTYAFNDIDLDGLKLRLKQDIIEEVAENVEEKVDSLNRKKPMSIDLKGIKFTNFNIDYGDDNTKTFAKVLFKELSTKVNKLDLENKSYDIGNLILSGADIHANLYIPNQSNNSKNTQKTEPSAQS